MRRLILCRTLPAVYGQRRPKFKWQTGYFMACGNSEVPSALSDFCFSDNDESPPLDDANWIYTFGAAFFICN